MTKTPARKSGPGLNNDGDATDAEINRKLTEHLRANAIKVGAEAAKPAGEYARPDQRSVLRPITAFGTAIAQLFGLAALLVLMALASIYARFYEKEAQ